MGVLSEWAVNMREAAHRDESVPFLASIFGFVILVLGFTLHGFMVAQKSDLVPLFDRPLPEAERARVARILEDECATCVFSPSNVLISRAQKARVLARLGQPDRPGAERDPLLSLIVAVAGAPEEPEAVSDGAARTVSASRPSSAGATVPVPEQGGGARGAWTTYNITCDEDGAGGELRRRPEPNVTSRGH